MKVFQVMDGFCHWDATPVHPTLESSVGMYAPDIVFVEAPDFVFEGWGYEDEEQGDARFIKPIPPEGWGYDDETGSFYPLNPPDPEPGPEIVTTDEFTEAYNEGRDSV